MPDSLSLPPKKVVFSLERAAFLTPYLIFIAILSFAFYIRMNTFWLPHWQGDQSQYVTLAMKLDQRGLEGYNLLETEIHFLTLEKFAGNKLVFPAFLRDQKGDLYRAYAQHGLQFYNELPLFYKGPFFPAVLMASHRLLAAPDQPYVVVFSNLFRQAAELKPSIFFKAQFWAVIVPFLSSLLMICLTFLFGKKLFNARVGLYASFLMAINPVDVIAAQRLLADDLATLFLVASLFIFTLSYVRRSYLGVIFSGFCCGFSILTKQNSILIFSTIGAVIFMDRHARGEKPFLFIFDKFFICYIFGTFFICGEWFLKAYQVYGNPFYLPDPNQMVRQDLSGWFHLLEGRPGLAILFFFYLPLLCPPFIFGHFSFKYFFLECKAFIQKKTGAVSPVIFLWLWTLPFFLFFLFRVESKEERYLLPVYPALAILSGDTIDRFRSRLAGYFEKPVYLDIFLALLFILSAAWSVPVALENVFNERFLILKPFKDWFTFWGMLND